MSLIGRIRASCTRTGVVMLATGAVAGCAAMSTPAPAVASTNQWAIIEDFPQLSANPAKTLQIFRSLGANVVRVDLAWYLVAPNANSRTRPSVNLADPNSYNWQRYDQMLNLIRQYGLSVDLLIGSPAPLWTTGTGAPSSQFQGVWFPSASDYGQFVQAVAKHYGWVNIWELWDEPNWGPALSPQLYNSRLPVSARTFRSLFNAGYSGLQHTGHGRNTIIAGSLSQDGSASVGQTGTTAPLTFMRTLYCLDSRYRQLRGNAAASVGCPTTKAGSRRFRGNNPGLFNASGVGVHPYPYAQPPNRAQFPDPNGVEFNEIPHLTAMLDRAMGVYGSKKRMAAYNTEYGYQLGYVTATNAAKYINWAEYLSYKNPRIAAYDQFELQDPAGFQTGLITQSGGLKPSFYAYRLPVWLPVASARRGRSLEVWGDVRPAHNARAYTGRAQYVAIQFASGRSGQFRTVKSVRITNGRGYFDVGVKFPSSGQVRLAWQYPTNVPALSDPADPNPSGWIYSRVTSISVR